MVSNNPTTYKHPIHLVTPSEIFSKNALSSDNSHTSEGMNVRDMVSRIDAENFEVDVKVIGEMGSNQEPTECERDRDSHEYISEDNKN